MIIVTRIWKLSEKNSESCTLGLEVEGHAQLAPQGKDILCAAVSVLSENLANSLGSLLGLPLEIEAKKGLYKLALLPELASEESELLFSSAFLGLGVLARQYPKRIELKERYYGS